VAHQELYCSQALLLTFFVSCREPSVPLIFLLLFLFPHRFQVVLMVYGFLFLSYWHIFPPLSLDSALFPIKIVRALPKSQPVGRPIRAVQNYFFNCFSLCFFLFSSRSFLVNGLFLVPLMLMAITAYYWTGQ